MSGARTGELSALAAARGLTGAAALLGRAAAAPLFDERRVPVDPRLDEPPHPRPKSLLKQMARRGLDPALVGPLWSWLRDRPLERALVAWDVLTQALLPVDDPFLDELRAAARPLAAVLPAPARAGLDLNRVSAADLVARHGGPPPAAQADTVAELVAAYDFPLALLARLAERGDPLVRAPEALGSVHAFARLLQLAHLPTLASVYFDYLSRALGWRAAALDLCETLFDVEASPFIPADAIRPGDVPEAEMSDLAEYLVYRSYLAVGEWSETHALLESNVEARGRRPLSPRLLVVRAHLGALAGTQPVPLGAVEQAVAGTTLWRYGAQVTVVVTAAQSPPASPRPLERWHDYVTGYGNDFRCWYEALRAAPASAAWRADSCAVLAREARHLPHERAVWKAIFTTLGGAAEVQRAVAELDERRARQATLG